MSGKALSPIAAWFRSSRRMLAAELSQGGWLNFGAFRWSDDDTDAVLLGTTDEFTDALDTAANLLRCRLNGS